jgi:hypothetical protein
MTFGRIKIFLYVKRHSRLPTVPFAIVANGLGLCEGGEIEVQMFILAQMLIRIPNAQI